MRISLKGILALLGLEERPAETPASAALDIREPVPP
jgi:hypothetical protein